MSNKTVSIRLIEDIEFDQDGADVTRIRAALNLVEELRAAGLAVTMDGTLYINVRAELKGTDEGHE